MTAYDVIVIGGGIAGTSIGYELSADQRVVLLEMESSLAFHTTGRSAATFLETYGGQQIRALTTSSRAFLENPPDFFEGELMTPRPLLQFARQGRGSVLSDVHSSVLPLVPDAELLDADRVADIFPFVNKDAIELGMYEPGAMDLDAIGLHGGYVRGLRSRGGEVVKSAPVVSISREGSHWIVSASNGDSWTAATVVNAAGAWGDEVAEQAGARRVGLAPLRRTIFMVNSPDSTVSKSLPGFADIDGTFYVKPEGAQFLCSPADETPCPPSDVSADELEIARALDEINDLTTLKARSVTSSWAGLRTFASDRNFVVGPDPDVEGFFWFVGQGGYGIQTAPASARFGAALVRGHGAPEDLVERGLDASALAPHRPLPAWPIVETADAE